MLIIITQSSVFEDNTQVSVAMTSKTGFWKLEKKKKKK